MAFSVRKDAVRRDGGFLAGRVLSWFLQGGRRQRQLTGGHDRRETQLSQLLEPTLRSLRGWLAL